jgi:hypothetical protein
MSSVRHHAEWLNLVPNSGPFVSLPVLAQTFPQGLDAHDAEHARRLRMAYEEWDDEQSSSRSHPALHRVWIRLVLAETLGFADVLAEGQAIPQTLKTTIAEYGETLRPEWIVHEPGTEKARLLVQTYPRGQALDRPVQDSRWKASPDTRMMQLLHDTGVRLGLVTNGEHWMLVNAPKNETTGYASWYAPLWFEEPLTLRAFRTLLGAERFFGVPEKETLEALLDRSVADQQEVTDQLGYQVRKAVEVLIQALDKADQDHGRTLLTHVHETVLYEAALTVMMRLVFLFCAEERDLLLLGDDIYDKNYAVSTLREHLRVTADQLGEEILGLRFDAWPRLLTTFRAVYGGVQHDRLKLPAYGGNLFNPDRFPFLEGRQAGTSWQDTQATPLPVSNRTVLHLLEALQILQVRLPGGGPTEARRLSFRSLDIEQIGHVYEGLLDHTAKRATEPVLGLAGTRDKEPEIGLSMLEQIAARDVKELLKVLNEETGRSQSAIEKGFQSEIDMLLASRFRTACQGDEALWKRVEPFAGLIRLDTAGYPVVIPAGSVYVTAGDDRRSSGTHYTPRILTEPLVQYTLEPLVYTGPVEGLPREQWTLRLAKALLDLKICDMACGSGAFLVQVCRYLSERLLEAWDTIQRANPGTIRITPEGRLSTGQPGETLLPDDPRERQTVALRLVAQRCIYGVDKNPLAVEMAKLSLWLLTLAKDKPFEFLDHAIRCGDSLIGIHSLEQLKSFSLDSKQDRGLFTESIFKLVDEAVELRKKIETMPSNSVEDVEAQKKLLADANEKTARLRYAADLLISVEFQSISTKERDYLHNSIAIQAGHYVKNGTLDENSVTHKALNGRPTFHWPLEFPEVLLDRGGFDAFVCNPPFMGGWKITGILGVAYRDTLVQHIAHGRRGSADLCSYFFLRSCELLRNGGVAGLLATDTIGQGATREVGLEQIMSGQCVIYRAVSRYKWPGTANLDVAQVWLRKGNWASSSMLDNTSVRKISPFLSASGTASGKPFILSANVGKSFTGNKLYGEGFILSPDEANLLIGKDHRNREVVFPYLTGDDLTSRPDQSPSRWVINFGNRTLEEASTYEDCLRFIEERVRPYRAMVKEARTRQHWWLHARSRPELWSAIAGLSTVFVISCIAKHAAFVRQPSHTVFDHNMAILISELWDFFAIVSSSVHLAWAGEFSSTVETRVGYRPSDCFDTFSFPQHSESLCKIGETYYEHRRQIMVACQEGLTKTYNRFHHPDEISEDIQRLRELHVEMDKEVAAAYNWADIDFDHGFHATKQGIRFTISEPARGEVLARLLTLNHERHEAEVREGLHNKKKASKGRTKKGAHSYTPTLFD